MPDALVIGSGPSAAGAAMALANDPSWNVMVIDVGGQLEPDLKAASDARAVSPEEKWDSRLVEAISAQPVASAKGALPQKRSYGSDFPFRDFGQLSGISSTGEANDAVISGAYGGFSNVWGAQIMPFSKATFERWPISAKEMEP